MTEKQKNMLNVAWKVGLVLIGLVILWVGIRSTWSWYRDNYGRCYWDDRTLSSSVAVHSFYDDCVRVWNSDTGSYTTRKLKWVSGTPERDSLTVFCDRKEKRGYLDVKSGKIVIPAQYKKAWHFSEGVAAVMGDNGKIGFINHDNQLILGYEIPYEPEFDYVFKDGYCVVTHWDSEKGTNTYAVYDKTGALVLPWGYTRLDEPNPLGYRVVWKDKEAWLYDRDYQPVFPDSYDDVELDDHAGVYLTRNHHKQLVDYEGKILEPFVIDSTYPLRYVSVYHEDEENEYELVPDVAAYRVGLWEGLLDTRTGKAITPAKYWSFEMISKDLIRAELGHDSESVILNKRGIVVKQ